MLDPQNAMLYRLDRTVIDDDGARDAFAPRPRGVDSPVAAGDPVADGGRGAPHQRASRGPDAAWVRARPCALRRFETAAEGTWRVGAAHQHQLQRAGLLLHDVRHGRAPGAQDQTALDACTCAPDTTGGPHASRRAILPTSLFLSTTFPCSTIPNAKALQESREITSPQHLAAYGKALKAWAEGHTLQLLNLCKDMNGLYRVVMDRRRLGRMVISANGLDQPVAGGGAADAGASASRRTRTTVGRTRALQAQRRDLEKHVRRRQRRVPRTDHHLFARASTGRQAARSLTPFGDSGHSSLGRPPRGPGEA